MNESMERVIADKLNNLTDKLDSNMNPRLGKDVDWSKYHLDPNVAHLYTNAVLKTTDRGDEWVTQIEVFDFVSGPYQPSKRSPKTLGEMVTERVNSGDRWKIATVFANQPGLGTVLFSRVVTVALPTPDPIIDVDEIGPAPTEEELRLKDEVTKQWLQSEGIQTEPEAKLVDIQDN